MFRWEKGRQESGYLKMLLLKSNIFKFDLYLIKFPQGSLIKPHTDIVQNEKHYRINIILKNAKEGGEFICSKLMYNSKRIKIFRPDIEEHSVSKIKEGTRLVISLGWIRK